MLVAGDEAGRTQNGNNNGYCHDEPSWFDWNLTRKNQSLVRFTQLAIAFRQAHPVLRSSPAGPASGEPSALPELSWHGRRAWDADWSPHNRLLAALFYAGGPDPDCVYVAANAGWQEQELELPAAPDGLTWHLFADTGRESPGEICPPGTEQPLAVPGRLTVRARSTVVLTARRLGDQLA
jgi:glycogen operon protein